MYNYEYNYEYLQYGPNICIQTAPPSPRLQLYSAGVLQLIPSFVLD